MNHKVKKQEVQYVSKSTRAVIWLMSLGIGVLGSSIFYAEGASGSLILYTGIVNTFLMSMVLNIAVKLDTIEQLYLKLKEFDEIAAFSLKLTNNKVAVIENKLDKVVNDE